VSVAEMVRLQCPARRTLADFFNILLEYRLLQTERAGATMVL
jgi:hypothetical protein